jgi:UDP-glucose 6-dehydrogenase
LATRIGSHFLSPGFAYVGGACVVNKRLEKVNSVAIIEDTGGFSGIIVGAHEVGHL